MVRYILLAGIVLFLPSCIQKKPETVSVPVIQQAAEKINSGSRTSESRGLPLPGPGTQKKKETAGIPVKKVLPQLKKEMFLPVTKIVVFSDTVIGQLADSLSPDPVTREVYECISSFFSSFSVEQ